jgi:hypothetical protein
MVVTGSIYLIGCMSYEIIRIQMGGQVFDVEKEERIGEIVSGNETAHTDTQVL